MTVKISMVSVSILAAAAAPRFDTPVATVIRPASVAVPRGAPIAANLALGLLRGFSRLGAALRRLATPEALHPLPAMHVRRRVAEASSLRSHAHNMMGTDPRFAADLFAAADRHERGA